MTPDSILVSWKAPELPNGIVNQYTVYIQEGTVNTESQSVPVIYLHFITFLEKKNS